MLELLAKYHKDWVNIAMSFLNDYDDANDIVQDMYLKVSSLKKVDDIRYKDGVNKYYIFLTLRNLCFDHIKNKRSIPIITIQEPEQDELIEETKIYDLIQNEIQTWDAYEKNLFEIYMYSGLSLRDIAYGTDKIPKKINANIELNLESVRRGSGISVSSMFHTIKKCKQRIKDKLHGTQEKI